VFKTAIISGQPMDLSTIIAFMIAGAVVALVVIIFFLFAPRPPKR
jgi:hypothetical protein